MTNDYPKLDHYRLLVVLDSFTVLIYKPFSNISLYVECPKTLKGTAPWTFLRSCNACDENRDRYPSWQSQKCIAARSQMIAIFTCNPCFYPEPLSPWPCKAFFISTVRRVPWAKWQPGSLLTAKHAKDDRKWLVSFSLNIFQEILKQRLTWRKHQISSFTPTQSESSKGSMKCPGNRHTIRMLGWTIFGPFEGREFWLQPLQPLGFLAVSRVGFHGCKNA